MLCAHGRLYPDRSDAGAAFCAELKTHVAHALNIGQDKMREINTLTHHEMRAAHAWAHSRSFTRDNNGKWKGALAKAKSIQRREYRAAAKARGPQLSTAVQGANNGKWKGALAKASSIQRRVQRAAAKARVAKAHAHARATA